jgi:hypothetical protein
VKSRTNVVLWICSALCAAIGLAGLVLAALGAGERGTDVALQLTARLSFLLFWPAYVGGALAVLFGSSFRYLKQYSRECGLAFASAHLVHIGLVAWLVHIGAAPPVGSFIFFGIAVAWTYLIALFSVGSLQHTLGPTLWWLLRTVGLNYIAYAFAVDFLRFPFFVSFKFLLGYLPFALLSVAGPLLRFAAFMQRTGYLQRASFKRVG